MGKHRFISYITILTLLLPMACSVSSQVINSHGSGSGTTTASADIHVSSSITPTTTSTSIPMDQGAYYSLATLDSTIIPVSDYSQIAKKYLGITTLSTQSTQPPKIYKEGDRERFFVLNDDTEEYSSVDAILRYATPHVYFWIQEGISYDPQALQDLVDAFEEKIYPTDRAYFGPEWTPGIDNDEHLYMLYTYGLGKYVGGYFSSEDENPLQIDEHSNAHEMFYIAADINLSDPFIYNVLAHEFAHMIAYYHDRNEDTWLSEGIAELASYINGYADNWEAAAYLIDHDIPITDWPADMSDSSPYYAGAFLFTTYLIDRFGRDITQRIVNSEASGLESLDAVFEEFGMHDELTGLSLTADRVYGDWEVANYLNDTSLVDGRYGYATFDLPFTADTTEYVSECPLDEQQRTVNQYGVDYIKIDCTGNITLDFNGNSVVPITDADPHSGEYFFWSNRGNESSMTLRHDFNFTNVNGEIKLSYWTWYDLEEEFDYVYLLVRPDGGEWQVIATPSCFQGKNSFGCGYTGTSTGWIEETVDLSQFAGQKVEIQFEYLTDLSVLNTGFFIDDISIPQINYFTDLESDAGGWVAEGFSRIENRIPQTFSLSLIVSDSVKNSVEVIDVPETSHVSIPLTLAPGQSVTLAVSGTAKYSLLPASYSYRITE
jgi:immune inhibitor A